MQLDRTHVAIRLRSLSEIGDLALVMIRRYPAALVVGFTLGAIPWMLADMALLSWIPIREASYGLDDQDAYVELMRYTTWMALLVIMQAPIAGAMTTLYLGLAVFEQKPTWKNVFRETRQHIWRLTWTLGIKRLTLPITILMIFRYDESAHGFFDVAIPIFLVIYLLIVRSSRPFLPEIMLLEQCPIRSKSKNVITLARRSRSLHSPMAGDLGGRFLVVSLILAWFALCVGYTIFWFRGLIFEVWSIDLVALLGIYPLCLWVIAGFSVFVRLLNYLDTRIRLEGWEVELAVRAEAIRQFGEDRVLTSEVESNPSPRTVGAMS